MPDREKVIRGILSCTQARDCTVCPYFSVDGNDRAVALCDLVVMRNALALLNGQTAQWIWDRPHHFRCSGCNGVIGQRTYLYCPNCGREMLLSETERMKEWPEEVSGDADGA